MKKMLVVLWTVVMMMGCGSSGKGGSDISLVGPSDVDAAMLSSSNKNEVSTGIATLSFSNPSLTVRAGEEFTVEVMVENVNMFGIAYYVKFNSDYLRFVKIEEDSFLKKDGVSTVLMKALKDGELIVGQTRLGHVLNASGSGTIAKITFKALNAGNTDVQFSESSLKEQIVEKGEYLLRNILFESRNATIRIE